MFVSSSFILEVNDHVVHSCSTGLWPTIAMGELSVSFSVEARTENWTNDFDKVKYNEIPISSVIAIGTRHGVFGQGCNLQIVQYRPQPFN